MNDFIAVTGRNSLSVLNFMDGKPGFTPTMGDITILELAAANDVAVERMLEIANKYIGR